MSLANKQTNKQTNIDRNVRYYSYQSHEIQANQSLAMPWNWPWLNLKILLPAKITNNSWYDDHWWKKKENVKYKIIRNRILPMPDKGSLFSSPLSLSRSAATAVRYWLKTSVTWRLYSLRAEANSSGRSSKITLKGKRYREEKQKPKNKQWEVSILKSIGKLMIVK